MKLFFLSMVFLCKGFHINLMFLFIYFIVSLIIISLPFIYSHQFNLCYVWNIESIKERKIIIRTLIFLIFVIIIKNIKENKI